MKEDSITSGGHITDRLTDLLTNHLSEAERAATEQHIAQCVSCQEAYQASRQLWENLGKLPVPQPGPGMRANFYNMLDTFREEEKELAGSTSLWDKLLLNVRNAAIPQWTFQLGFSLLLVALGWTIGYRMKAPGPARPEEQIDALAAQVQDVKSAMMLALIDNPSAAERLRAVSYTSEIANADERVINALFATLNNDPNVNVRLVTLEALAEYADLPEVREQLVKSLLRQDSPMIQAALADVMVRLQEKSAVSALKTLLRKDNLDHLVKIKIEQSIRDLS
ncbi:HEAT repeat domain-containing protein [Dyadobacter sandarakinus]|uniref:HEAT repeat domain-containing protein n=1 Tax=Dyadobacter sandarakinus TaxID=2747268 RepID=A0ABX7I3B3_9BACT|nr:HEAT repeat domain-containing protein [Dyadobacter sandarakinus]QRR00383.1 HEAT repeat domain-containing protein [Dyadobacter sandarakinus]